MGKGNQRFIDELSAIDEKKKELDRERKRKAARCVHQSTKGNLKLIPLNGEGDFECKYCKLEFNMTPMTMDELQAGVEIVHNALQQVRAHTDVDNDKEMKLAVLLGELDYNLDSLTDVYSRVINIYERGRGNGNNKRNGRGDRDGGGDFGYYANGSVSFISGGNGGKKKRFN